MHIRTVRDVMCMCDEEMMKKENGKGDEVMAAAIKPVKSTEIHFDSDEEYDKFINYIENPPEPSEYVKNMIQKYKEFWKNQ